MLKLPSETEDAAVKVATPQNADLDSHCYSPISVLALE